MLHNVIYPVLMISIIMLLIILIPLPLTEKIPHLLTLLLVITVYQLILLDNLPASKKVTTAG